VVAVIAVMVAVVVRIQSSRHPVDTATVYSGDLAAVAIAVTILLAVAGWWRKNGPRLGATSAAQAAAAAERLAEVMADRWRREATIRRITSPAPMTVRWRWAAAVVTADVATPPVPGAGPLPLSDPARQEELLGSGVVERLHDELYARLPHGRLVVLGGPGVGKTGAMVLLLLAALGHRAVLTDELRGRVPVPVWLTMGSWDPADTSLQEWAVAAINRDHPALRAPEYGSDAAGELLRSGRVALFLDGLDEMPEGVRAQAMRRVDEEARGLRVVLSSRPAEFWQTMTAGRPDNTAVIELLSVRPSAAAAYLVHGQPRPGRERWELLGSYLKQYPDSVAARALDNPLTLSLARDAYIGQNPVVLTNADRFSSVRAMREHLLTQLLVTAYSDEHQRAHATRWLAWIAGQMGASRDLSWWEIPAWVPLWKLRLVFGLAAGLLFGLAVGLAIAHIAGAAAGLVTGTAAGSVFGALVALGVNRVRGFHRLPRAFVLRWPPRALLVGMLGFGLGIGLLIGLVLWLSVGLAVVLGAGPASKAGPGLALAFVAGFVFGLATGLVVIYGYLCTTPVAASASATAVSSYHADRRTSVIAGIVIGFVAGIMTGFGVGIPVGIAAGLGAGLLSALVAVQVPVVKLILSFQEGSRVHFRHLLEDALHRQLLRQASTVYQFRHADLQDHLAAMNSQPQ
jgi:hypothetical protein